MGDDNFIVQKLEHKQQQKQQHHFLTAKEAWKKGLEYETKFSNHELAIECYLTAIQMDPRMALAFKDMGNVYYRLKYFDKAVECYNRATELDPKFAIPYYNRSLVYGKMNNHKAEIEELEKAIALESSDPDYFYNRASAYRKMGNNHVAMTEIQNMLERFPNYLSAYLLRGNLHLENNEDLKAELDYNQCLRIEMNNPYAYYNLSIVCAKREQYVKATYYMCLAASQHRSDGYIARKLSFISNIHRLSSDSLTSEL